MLGQVVATMADGWMAGTPPFDLDLIGDQLVAYSAIPTRPARSSARPSTSPTPRSRAGKATPWIRANFDPSGNGQLVLSIDGTVVANYAAPARLRRAAERELGRGHRPQRQRHEVTAVGYAGTTIASGSGIAFADPVPYVRPPSLNVGEFSPDPTQPGVVDVPVVGYALGNTPSPSSRTASWSAPPPARPM